MKKTLIYFITFNLSDGYMKYFLKFHDNYILTKSI
jgi:hypothetical protein